ncbi:MAG: alpha/beta hydrolase fold domain-containing protein, partial [Perlucidibaca sp.]
MKLPDTLTKPLTRAGLRVSFKLASTLPLPLPVLRGLLDAGARVFRPRGDVLIEQATLGGLPAERITPAGQPGRVLLHFHGGAFFAGSARSHRALGSELAARSQAVVYLPDYRKAPEHPYPAALEDALQAYRSLLAQGWSTSQIVLGGDSGGCALIVALAIALRDDGQALPAGLVMISPYLDLSLSQPSVRA